MRLFVALDLPSDVRAAAWTAAAPLRAALPSGIAWVRADALHVTLHFLGERSPGFANALAADLAAALADVEPPRIELTVVGAFPSPRRPRVLWIGGPANSAVAALYHVVAGACGRAGAALEPRPFHPHVTIGRVRRGAEPDPAVIARASAAVRVSSSFVADVVHVVRSELSAAGARYRVLAAIPVGFRR